MKSGDVTKELAKLVRLLNTGSVKGRILIIVQEGVRAERMMYGLPEHLNNVKHVRKMNRSIATREAEIFIFTEREAFGDRSRGMPAQDFVLWITDRQERLRWLRSAHRNRPPIVIDDGYPDPPDDAEFRAEIETMIQRKVPADE